jgi:hypothetical protein
MDRHEAFTRMQATSAALSEAIRDDDFYSDDTDVRQAYDARVDAASVAHLAASRAYDRAVAAEGPQMAINEAFRRLGVETNSFRVDDDCTTRIGSTMFYGTLGDKKWATVYVSDHMQGRGKNVRIADATVFDVRLSTARQVAERTNVAFEDLYDTLLELLTEAY